MKRNPKQCPRCGDIVSEKKYNRHIEKRCGIPSMKKFIRLYRIMMAGYRLPHRDESFVKNFLATADIFRLERAFRKVAKMDPYTEVEDLRHGQRLSKAKMFSIIKKRV